MPLPLDAVPALWHIARLQFDPVRQQRVLLYPEGAVLLSDSAAEILELCDGQRTVADIAAILGQRYDCDVTTDVSDYLSELAESDLVIHQELREP
jgi:pyrroloquinoline quinone biosynthesis protein D